MMWKKAEGINVHIFILSFYILTHFFNVVEWLPEPNRNIIALSSLDSISTSISQHLGFVSIFKKQAVLLMKTAI